MKKADLANVVLEIVGGTKTQSEEVVNAIFDNITSTLAKGEEVDIAGFGKFVSSKRAAREARNPRTGETVMVPARNVPKFKASKKLKDAVA